MTETTETNYQELASNYITAIKEADVETLAKIPTDLEGFDQQVEALTAILEAIDKEDEAFKTDNADLIGKLKETKAAQDEALAEAEVSSDSATEGTDGADPVAVEAEEPVAEL